MASVHSINLSNGGVPKTAVQTASISSKGIAGDRQAKPGIHGGIYKAVSLFSLEVIQSLATDGHPIAPGSAGENITVTGLDWTTLLPATVLQIGAAVQLKISMFATPCASITGCFSDGDFMRLHHSNPGQSRVYAQVLKPGEIRIGDKVQILQVPV